MHPAIRLRARRAVQCGVCAVQARWRADRRSKRSTSARLIPVHTINGARGMRLQLTPRLGYLAGFVVCGGLLAYALYLQYYEYQNPCPLCILQRVAYMALMVVFLIGAMHAPRRAGAWAYSTLLVIIGIV